MGGCCLLALASWVSPRFILFLLWIFGDRLEVAFDSFLTGLLGFLVVPWASLCFALASAPVDGVTGIGWLVVAGGLFADLGSWLGGGRQGRVYYVEERR